MSNPIYMAAGALTEGIQETPGMDLGYERVIIIATGLMCFFLRVSIILVIGGIAWYGIKMIMSQGSPGPFSSAKAGLIWAFTALAVILGAGTIILTVAAFIGAPTPSLPSCVGL
ncbi:MAG: hypothetical protein QY311_01875 [Candidatus Paceibacterota bacterium]|nr:MAG: hypothetical protein QY311_01875 [Candidatus Paceibacterota bacterium]